ncbi:MAG: glycosyltransferase family 2 protein [Candidatus Cryptobacteroides sp.]
MNNPKISVIVPVYNAESTIRRCVDSILAQTFTDFECLLIDDGSKDRSGAICDEYAEKDSRVRVFHKENGGVSSARNLGLDNATGEWIAFVDSDDWVDSYYLSSFEIEEEIDLSCAHMMVEGWKEWESIPLLDQTWVIGPDFLSYIIRRSNYPFCKLFRRLIITDNRIRFNESIHYGEDTLFVYSFIYFVGVAKTVSSAGYHYNCNNINSLSKKHHNWEEYSYTIDKICNAINRLENTYAWNGYDERNIIVNNLLTTHLRYIMRHCGFLNIYNELRRIVMNNNVLIQINDNKSWNKSISRRVFDSLIKSKMYILCSLYLYISRYVV